ncbi:hypothetical protein CAPTEDRAFT_217077 [Capitella teleta]|uniref:Uncharacterized protein n=1 Tax=Capitella teleta TaxID=283909 RepID=R7TLM7_CAPTE|nr:hypothetical protein CAPTEDRAFT_217077 [Capitella teleta]|eukprot:ELT94574.1 hypothetical protein CAPTEDRAFT_217077 [Capitella teleta]
MQRMMQVLKKAEDPRPNKSQKAVRVAPLVKEPTALDEEGIKTRTYWEKWAAQAVKGIMEEIHQVEEGLKLKQVLYSGRIGKEPRLTRSVSEESIATEISLLTCSSLHKEQSATGRKKRKKKSPEKKQGPKPDWVKMARERRGYVLNKFIRRDAGMMDVYKGDQASSDVMTSEERALLTKAAYSKGLGGISKSQSTENVLTHVLKPPPQRSSGGSTRRRWRRCESPRLLASDADKKGKANRSHSVSIQNRSLTFLQKKKPGPLPSPFELAPRLPSSCSAHIGSDTLLNSQPDEAVLTKLHATLGVLQRSTGYGDGCHVLSIMPDESGKFTDVDYAHIPRYPQNIRIAPQLSRSIREEVKQRVTRPKRNTVKIKDLRKLDAENPIMQRTQQNMLIFNWLNSLEEEEIGPRRAPSIYDLEEGVAPDLKYYPRIFNELVEGVSSSSMVAHTDATSMRSTQDNLDDELADRYDEEWGSEQPTGIGTIQT